MKQDDFERLKAICEKEGFDIIGPWDEGMVVVKKTDPWEGVEFFEVTGDIVCYTKGRIYKITDKSHGYILNSIDDSEIEGSIGFDYIKPSTESAYVEQLKKEAFKRFGEINSDNVALLENFELDQFTIITKNEWVYDREIDALFYWGYCLYKQGKWAEKVKERVEVEIYCMDNLTDAYGLYVDMKGTKIHVTRSTSEIKSFIASQLEKFLNGEIE